MKNTMKFALAAAVSLVALEASAGGFAVRQQSVTAQGTSYAGTGTGAGGISGMFWNPAAITSKEGRNSEWNFSTIVPYSSVTPTVGSGILNGAAPGSGNTGIGALIPASYNNWQLNDQIWIGLQNTAPFGSKTKTNDFWSGQIYGRSVKLRNMNVTPTIGIKPVEWISFGFGVQISYMNVSLKRVIPTAATAAGLVAASSPFAPTSELEGNGFGMGWTAGVTIRPSAATEIGFGFRSSINHNLQGHLHSQTTLLPIRASINLPEIATLGVSHQLNDQVKLLGSVEWTNWSRAKNAPVTYNGVGVPVSAIYFQYRDGWMFSLGGEYKATEALTLRAGLAYEMTPISDSVRSVTILDNDRIWASIGATYQWNQKLSIDATYTHIFIKNPDVNIVAGNPHFLNPAINFVGNGKAHADIFSVGLKYRWDEPPVRQSPAVVRKG